MKEQEQRQKRLEKASAQQAAFRASLSLLDHPHAVNARNTVSASGPTSRRSLLTVPWPMPPR
jgi:hypothetical protein